MAGLTATSAFAAAGGGLQGLGTIMGYGAQRSAGAAQNAQYVYRAQQEEQAAGQARAAAQREAFDEDKKTNLLQSSLQARAASDGGSATDPTALTLSEGIAGQGAFNSAAAMYRGEERALGLIDQAAADRMSGRLAKKGAAVAATGTLLSGFGSLASKYGSFVRSCIGVAPGGIVRPGTGQEGGEAGEAISAGDVRGLGETAIHGRQVGARPAAGRHTRAADRPAPSSARRRVASVLPRGLAAKLLALKNPPSH